MNRSRFLSKFKFPYLHLRNYRIYCILFLLTFTFAFFRPQEPVTLQEFQFLALFSLNQSNYNLWSIPLVNQLIGLIAFGLFYWGQYREHLNYFLQFPAFKQSPQRQAHESSLSITLWMTGLFGFFVLWAQHKDGFVPFLIGVLFFNIINNARERNLFLILNSGLLSIMIGTIILNPLYQTYFLQYHTPFHSFNDFNFTASFLLTSTKKIIWQEFHLWVLLILVYRRWKSAFSIRIKNLMIFLGALSLFFPLLWLYFVTFFSHQIGKKLAVLRTSDRALLDYLNGLIFSFLLIIIWVIFLVSVTHYPQYLFLKLQGIAPHYPENMALPFISITASSMWIFAIMWRKNRWDVSLLRCSTHVLLGTTVIALCYRELLLPIVDYAKSYQLMVQNLEKMLNTVQIVHQKKIHYCIKFQHKQQVIDKTSIAAFEYYLPKKWWCSNVLNQRNIVPLTLSITTDRILEKWRMNRFSYRKNGDVKRNHEVLLWVGRRPTDRHTRYILNYFK